MRVAVALAATLAVGTGSVACASASDSDPAEASESAIDAWPGEDMFEFQKDDGKMMWWRPMRASASSS